MSTGKDPVIKTSYTVTTPKQRKEQQNAVISQLTQLFNFYSKSIIEQHFSTFCDNFALVTLLNQELADSGNYSGEQYDNKMKQILTATDHYYSYITALPSDIRSVFLLLMGLGTQELEDIKGYLETGVLRKAKEDLSLRSIRPQKYIMQIDAISNQLAKLNESTTLRVGGKVGRPITTTVTLNMPDHMKIDGGALSTYDKSIVNGVTSLLESGNLFFSIPMLYHAMTGKQNPTMDEQLAYEIATRLEKMRRMTLSIDLSEEIQQSLYKPSADELGLSQLEIEGYLLPLNKISGLINGKRTEMYQIIHDPPLYTYSKVKRQLASVPLQLLDAPINNNSTTIPLKTYLIQRIEMMKNTRNRITSSRVLYDSIYEELGAEEANKTRKMRIRTYTTAILEHFIQEGYIKAYLEFRSGRAIGGVEIML